MFNFIHGIDHALIAVRDLDQAAETYARLGFTVTPRGNHPEWGTANHCVMFGGDYLELIGTVGAGQTAEKVTQILKDQGEGGMALAFGTSDAAAAYEALRKAGIAVEAPRSLSRNQATPQGDLQPKFSVVALSPDATPGISAFLCQHLTPEVVRQPDWLRHPNGALKICSVTAVVEDPESRIGAYDAIFGPGASTATDSTVAVHTGRGLLFLCNPDEVSQLHPTADRDPAALAPSIVAITIGVRDTDATARLLDDNDVEFTRDSEGTIRLEPEETHGLFLEFTKA